MEITKETFQKTKEISMNFEYLQPKIELRSRDCTLLTIDCKNRAAAMDLYDDLVRAWTEVKNGT